MQLDDFEAFFKDMSKDSAYKFSLQFEVQLKSRLLRPTGLTFVLRSRGKHLKPSVFFISFNFGSGDVSVGKTKRGSE